MLTDPEERALSGIEAVESARDPAFARQFGRRKGSKAMSAMRVVFGPVLCLVAVPLTIALLVASPWLGLVGIALFAVGMVLSVRPVAELGERIGGWRDRSRSG